METFFLFDRLTFARRYRIIARRLVEPVAVNVWFDESLAGQLPPLPMGNRESCNRSSFLTHSDVRNCRPSSAITRRVTGISPVSASTVRAAAYPTAERPRDGFQKRNGERPPCRSTHSGLSLPFLTGHVQQPNCPDGRPKCSAGELGYFLPLWNVEGRPAILQLDGWLNRESGTRTNRHRQANQGSCLRLETVTLGRLLSLLTAMLRGGSAAVRPFVPSRGCHLAVPCALVANRR